MVERWAGWFVHVAVALLAAACGGVSPSTPDTAARPAGTLPAGLVPTAVAFQTARRGLIGGVVTGPGSAPLSCQPICRGSFVAETHDGGDTWHVVWRGRGARPPNLYPRIGRPRSDPCRPLDRDGFRWGLLQVARGTATRSWALCSQGIEGGGMVGRAIVESTDGGRRWKVVTAAPFNSGSRGMSSYGDPEGIDFLPDGHGWLWEGPRGVSLATTDGGAHWRPLKLGVSDSVWVESGWFVSPRIGYALISDPGRDEVRLEVTRTSGRKWRTVCRWRIADF